MSEARNERRLVKKRLGKQNIAIWDDTANLSASTLQNYGTIVDTLHGYFGNQEVMDLLSQTVTGVQLVQGLQKDIEKINTEIETLLPEHEGRIGKHTDQDDYNKAMNVGIKYTQLNQTLTSVMQDTIFVLSTELDNITKQKQLEKTND